MNGRTKNYKREPQKYFRLEVRQPRGEYFHLGVRHPREVVPDEVLAMLGRVIKGDEWERLGFIPYNFDEFDPMGKWQSTSFGCHVANGATYTFAPYIDQIDRKWAEAIRTGKRHVETEFDVLTLRRLGVPYAEMAKVPTHYRSYAEATLAQDRNDLVQAIEHARAAVQQHPHSERYHSLLFDLRVSAGDVSLMQEGLQYYSADMDSAVHAGYVERWLKLAISAENGYRLALDTCLAVLCGLDALVAGTSEGKRIYGRQSIEWYVNVRAKFLQRLGTMRGFLCPDLVRQNGHRADDLERLFSLIVSENPAKGRTIDRLRALMGGSVDAR